jgi:hypothetical protein
VKIRFASRAGRKKNRLPGLDSRKPAYFGGLVQGPETKQHRPFLLHQRSGALSTKIARANPRGKPTGGTISDRTDVAHGTPPAALPIFPADASSGPRHCATLWINAVEALDTKEAIKRRRELLKRFGILISLAPHRGGRSS